MFDQHMNVGLTPDDGIRLSNNVAVFLSRKVTEAQGEIVDQLRAEMADHTRPETARKEADKGRPAENKNGGKGGDVPPAGDPNEKPSPAIGQLNITV
jgi:hypothetical protein